MTTALSARPRRALFLAATLVAAAAQAGDSSRYDTPHYYNGGGQLLLAVGGGVHALVTSPLGTLGSVSLRAGWSSAGRPSLELRGGVDVLLGSRRGLTVVAGGLWMPLGLGHRVFVGLGAEAGVLVPFDGRAVGVAARGGAGADVAAVRHVRLPGGAPDRRAPGDEPVPAGVGRGRRRLHLRRRRCGGRGRVAARGAALLTCALRVAGRRASA